MDEKVRILFLHPNFPGQFKYFANHLGALKSVEVKFICLTDYGNSIQGVEKLIIKGDRGQGSLEREAKDEISKNLFRAESYRRAFKLLNSKGWVPKFVIAHTGWGCGMHVKEIWPKTNFLGYIEWWFSPDSLMAERSRKNKFINYSESTQKKLWQRNRFIGFEAITADRIIAPTKWQRQQLPQGLRERCEVIRDGLDINYLSGEDKRNQPDNTPIITYGTRGMEPIRCFREFIKCLPYLFKKLPNARVLIAGEDKICYGGNQPAKGLTWGNWASQYLKSANLENKVEFLGHLPQKDYKYWLQRSWCHVYLSEPYVCSWSLLDAIALGLPIVASNTPPVLEYCENLAGVKLVNNQDIIDIADKIHSTVIEHKESTTKVLRVSRQDLLKALSLDRSIAAWEGVTRLDLNTLD